MKHPQGVSKPFLQTAERRVPCMSPEQWEVRWNAPLGVYSGGAPRSYRICNSGPATVRVFIRYQWGGWPRRHQPHSDSRAPWAVHRRQRSGNHSPASGIRRSTIRRRRPQSGGTHLRPRHCRADVTLGFMSLAPCRSSDFQQVQLYPAKGGSTYHAPSCDHPMWSAPAKDR